MPKHVAKTLKYINKKGVNKSEKRFNDFPCHPETSSINFKKNPMKIRYKLDNRLNDLPYETWMPLCSNWGCELVSSHNKGTIGLVKACQSRSFSLKGWLSIPDSMIFPLIGRLTSNELLILPSSSWTRAQMSPNYIWECVLFYSHGGVIIIGPI